MATLETQYRQYLEQYIESDPCNSPMSFEEWKKNLGENISKALDQYNKRKDQE